MGRVNSEKKDTPKKMTFSQKGARDSGIMMYYNGDSGSPSIYYPENESETPSPYIKLMDEHENDVFDGSKG